MGIYDRDYYRREGPSFLGSLAEQGRVTTWLIGINVVCFIIQFVTRSKGLLPAGMEMPFPDDAPIPKEALAQLFTREPFTDALLLNVDAVLHGQIWRLLSYAFLHDTNSIWHIVFNMLFLFWFGRHVEDVLGAREYLWFYLTSATLSGVAFVLACLFHLHGGMNRAGEWIYPNALGASGAVTSVLVLSAIYNPRQVIYMFFVIPVPIWAFVVLNVCIDSFNLLGNAGHGVATSAHLGGAAFGFLYYRYHWRVSAWTYWVTGWWKARKKPKLRIYRDNEEESTPSNGPRAPVTVAASSTRLLDDEQLEAQVDAILAKIPEVGMQGLSENERQLLLRASEEIKRRRT